MERKKNALSSFSSDCDKNYDDALDTMEIEGTFWWYGGEMKYLFGFITATVVAVFDSSAVLQIHQKILHSTSYLHTS